MVTTGRGALPPVYNPVTGALVTDPEERIILQQYAREQAERRENAHEHLARDPEPVRPTAGPRPRSSLLELGKAFFRSAQPAEERPAEAWDWPPPSRPDYAAQRRRQEMDERNRRDRAKRKRRREIIEARTGKRLPGPRGIVDR